MEQARYAAGDKRKGKLRVFLVHFGLSASIKETKKKRDLMGEGVSRGMKSFRCCAAEVQNEQE